MDFKEAQQAYARLKDQFGQGYITAREFEARVNDMVVVDSAGTLWQIGVKSGKWYRFDNMKWVEDMPPGLSPLPPAAAAPERMPRPGTPVSKRPLRAPERISRRLPERISQSSNQLNGSSPAAGGLWKRFGNNCAIWVINGSRVR